MKEENLEKVVEAKEQLKELLPLIKETMHKFLGVTISELNEDLTSKLNKNSLLNIKINLKIKYKQSKKQFKKDFVTRLLQVNLANVSEAAKVAGINRRSIHRIIHESRIDIDKIRKELIKPSYIKKTAVTAIVENVLKQYSDVIHPTKLDKMYKNVSMLSEDIVQDLPDTNITFKEAEEFFDREYLMHALDEGNFNISKTAKNIGLRYETLYRKIKKLRLFK